MPNFTAATGLHATDLNGLLKIIGGGFLAGAAPTYTTSMNAKMLTGTGLATTNASGDAAFTFPVAFATTLISLQVTSANPAQLVIAYADPAGTAPPSLTGFSYHAYALTGLTNIVSTSVRFSYTAIGI